MKKAIFAALFAFGLLSAVSAEENYPTRLDPETKMLCNKVMVDIYRDILSAKDKFKQLSQFGEKSLYENKYGIYTIVYKYAPGEDDPNKAQNYEFGITIDGIDDVTFADKKGAFNLAFPLLGLKFSGYQARHLLRSQYNLMNAINKHGAALSMHQQKYIPLQLTLRALKDTYKIREDIEFEVTLKNISNRHMVVKDLGMETLYFLFEDMVWGTSPNSAKRGGGNVVLKSGESVKLKFKGESFQKPRDIQIYCAYRMSIKGVNPAGTLNVKIIDDPDNPANSTLPPSRRK
jgi:hypothetical protein